MEYGVSILLPTAYCLLPTAYCLLPTAYCLLPTLLIPAARRAAMRVFRKSMAIVSGPTPPGTGVIRDATSTTLEK